MPKNNQSRRHPQKDKPAQDAQDQAAIPHIEHDHGPDEHTPWAGEKAQQQSRQHAMAAREKATRTQLSVGQTGVMRLKKGNQPRGSR